MLCSKCVQHLMVDEFVYDSCQNAPNTVEWCPSVHKHHTALIVLRLMIVRRNMMELGLAHANP